MEFDNEIRSKIRMDLPKIILYDGQENEMLKRQYVASVYNQKDIFTKILNVQLQYEDTDELFVNNNISKRMMVFFLNYLQNENLLKGEDLSKKLYFGLINIKSYDENGNLEYDSMEQFQQYLFLPNYIDEVYNEIVLLIVDLERWYCLYLHKEKQVGQLFDFKNQGKVDVYENLEVLNEIIQAEFNFQIINFDIRVLQENINIDTDGGFFIINLLYKLVQGVQLENIAFNAKEKGILKDRLDWLVLKAKDIQDNNENPKTKSKGKFQSRMNESEDIILDEAIQKRPTKSNNSFKSKDLISQKKIQEDDQSSQNDSMLFSHQSQKQSRKPTIFMNKGRQKTKIISKNQQNQQNDFDRSDFQESFDYRSQNDIQQGKGKRQFLELKDISYQESVNEDLGQMWNFKEQQKKKPTQPKYDQNEEEMNKLWDFKAQYKKGLRQRQNQPVLIPEEHKQLYQQRNDQSSQQREFQDKVIDVITFLDSPDNQDLLTNPVIEQLQFIIFLVHLILQLFFIGYYIIYLISFVFFIILFLKRINFQNNQFFQIKQNRQAVNRLKQQLGIKQGKGGNNDDLSEDLSQKGGTQTKNIGELKKIIKQRMIENATGDLDALLEKQKILNDILDYDMEDRKGLERRFENEIKKIDSRFQEYMQRYDAMNQYESLQAMYRNAYHGPPDYEISQMKDSMHLELQNYLLSGLGLPSNFSSNPFFQRQKDEQRHSIQQPSNSLSQSQQNSKIVPQFNQSMVKQNNSNSSGQIFKNNSMINLNNQKSPDSSNSKDSKNRNPQQQQLDLELKDAIARRYNVVITKKNLIDALTQDRLEENVINFLLGYLEEKYYHENSRSIMIRDENRIFLYPINFYTELSQNNPLVKQQQLNYSEVSKYTKNYINKYTIFDEFDKLIIPIRIAKPQLFTLVVVDINVRQIIYFPIIKNINFNNQNNSNNNSIQSNSINISDASQLSDNPLQNPISLNILKYLEKEYSNKCMKNFKILNWSLTNIGCTQTSSPALSTYYMLIYIIMIMDQNYLFKSINNETIKQFKVWMPEVFKTVGITNNKIGDINYFVSLK